MNLRLVCTLVGSITLLGLQTEAYYCWDWYCGYWKYKSIKENRERGMCEKEKRAVIDDLNRLRRKCDQNGTITKSKVNETNGRCAKEKEALIIEATRRCETEKEALRADFNRQSSNQLRILARQLSDCLKKPSSGTCSADVKCFWDSFIETCIPKELAL
ncbi:uncharacterized protein LOC134256371 [Saccostrea cucullata]|uniref:uncharacterized protein LOC134256371 n=1 Tax=Saccostrea cuccullata TaxID=36930 RepID=UPI002ED4D42B